MTLSMLRKVNLTIVILLFRFKDNVTHSRRDEIWSRVAQRKRAGPITQRSKDRNLVLLFLLR